MLSMTASLRRENSAFRTTSARYIYAVLRLAHLLPVCYIIVRKGDTNVQVNKQLKEKELKAAEREVNQGC